MPPTESNGTGSVLFVLGSSHRTAPTEVRERFAVPRDRIDLLSRDLNALAGLSENLVLNTCNRVEVYGVAGGHEDEEAIRQRLEGFLREFHEMEDNPFREFGYWRSGVDAIRHLFEVASGIDSQMVGETEILGQVKASYADAGRLKTVGPVLHRILQKSFQAAKWARTHTAIGQGQVSIGNVAAELAIRVFGKLKRCRVLLIGAGEVGELTATALRSRGARDLTVSSRTFARAEDVAGRVGANAVSFDRWHSLLDLYDIVVSATAAKGWILERADVESAMAKRRSRPLFLLDLAHPRDIDPQCGEIENVFAYTLEDLAEIANRNLAARSAEIETCRQQLAERAFRIWRSLPGFGRNGT